MMDMANMVKTENTASWNLCGTDAAKSAKIADALKKVGLDFKVEKRNLFFGPNMKKLENNFATVRTDREEEMGVVGKGYQIAQNDDAFAFADFIDDNLRFTRGGLTYDGLCWIVAEMPSVKILGEEYIPAVVLQNSFNGKYMLRANIVALHKESGSQINMGMNGLVSTIKVRHSKNIIDKMKQGQETLVVVGEYMDGLRKMAEKYANIKMDKAQIELFLSVLFPVRKDMSEQTKATVIAKRKMFMGCFDDDGNKTHQCDAWGLIRAYADYTTHTIGKNTKTKYERKFVETSVGKSNFGSFLKKLAEVTGTKVSV